MNLIRRITDKLRRKPLLVKPVVSDSLTIPYIKSEYDLQIQQMQKLGINTDSQLFEQCVNAALYRLETINLAHEAMEQELLNRFGFSKDGGILADNQLKIWSFMDWVKENYR